MPPRITPRKPVRVYLAMWRERAKLTQQQVADRMGHGNKGTVSRWETAARVPSTRVLAAYAEALKIPTVSLYRRPTERPSLDAMIADAPEDLQRKAAEMIEILVGKPR